MIRNNKRNEKFNSNKKSVVRIDENKTYVLENLMSLDDFKKKVKGEEVNEFLGLGGKSKEIKNIETILGRELSKPEIKFLDRGDAQPEYNVINKYWNNPQKPAEEKKAEMEAALAAAAKDPQPYAGKLIFTNNKITYAVYNPKLDRSASNAIFAH